MPTAEQLLAGKGDDKVLNVTFPTRTLFEPYQEITSGEIYRSKPIPTLTLAIKKEGGANEYFFAKPLGDVFKVDPSVDKKK